MIINEDLLKTFPSVEVEQRIMWAFICQDLFQLYRRTKLSGVAKYLSGLEQIEHDAGEFRTALSIYRRYSNFCFNLGCAELLRYHFFTQSRIVNRLAGETPLYYTERKTISFIHSSSLTYLIYDDIRDIYE